MARVLKKSPIVKLEVLERNINNAKAVVTLSDELTKKDFLDILDTILDKSCVFVPEEELEPFRLPKGMIMR